MVSCVQITAPASKSMSHRVVMAAALASGKSLIHGVLESDDLTRTMGCLRACGVQFDPCDQGLWVTGVGGRPQGGVAKAPADLFMHESGTTCRLMTAVAAAGQGVFRVHGAPRLHERPMASLAQALKPQGVTFAWEERAGFPPFSMTTQGLGGGGITVDVGDSSQYLSGLLLVAPCAASPTIISIGGSKVVSWPYVALTLQTLEDFGIDFTVQRLEGGTPQTVAWRNVTKVAPGSHQFCITPGPYAAGERRVEGDWSSASYFLAAGAVGKRPVHVSGLRKESLQGDRALVEILQNMGVQFQWDDQGVTVLPCENLVGVDVDMATCPDIVPTLAVAAAFAKTPTRISGVAHLRIKECDRLAGTANILGLAGVDVDILDDGLVVRPKPMTPGAAFTVPTQGDHRMAMSAALLTLAGLNLTFDDSQCVGKSFPDFWTNWNKIVA